MYNPFDDPNYCEYCKCSPCQCDGHGNFGEIENVSWYPENLDTERFVPTFADGTPIPRGVNWFDFHPEDRPRDLQDYIPDTSSHHRPSLQLEKERDNRDSERPQRPR